MIRRMVVMGFVVLSLFFASKSFAQMSHEEEVVRNAYAKFSTLCAIETLSKINTSQEVDQPTVNALLDQTVPTFTLSDFHSGPIADIADQPWGSLVTDDNAVPEVLTSTSTGHYNNDNGNMVSWTGRKVRWTKPIHQVMKKQP